MKEYYQDLILKTNNPLFKNYYNEMLKYHTKGEKPKIDNFLFKKGLNRVYSVKLDKYFNTMSEASRYVEKGRSYTRRCIIGELENKFEFKIV